MPLYAIEILLTRPARRMELRAAVRSSRMKLAPSEELDRIAVLVTAEDEGDAMSKVWGRIENALPVDALVSIFPDADGKYTLSFPLPTTALHRITQQAAAAGCTPEQLIHDALVEALARDRTSPKAQLDSQLNKLLRDFPPADIAGAIVRRLRP
ncbi:hypothetical protein ACIO13_34105 [Streptomyces sp. NPDC087425]|uniref:hypothetical protein n=1 Tax=Streptomyces sp. NPDC087425 TaxID=3365787 RepID=UPI0037FD96E6